MTVPKATYAREHFSDPRMERLQNEVKNLRALIAMCPFIDGVLVQDEPLTTSASRVKHRLGRSPKGVILLKSSPPASVGFSAAQPTDTVSAVHVQASASTTATLWFR